MTLEQHNLSRAGDLVGKKATRIAILSNFRLLPYLTWETGVFQYTPESKKRIDKMRERSILYGLEANSNCTRKRNRIKR